jgi:hypothetical protein
LTEQKSATSAAEVSAVTAPTVVSGLGYPADRIETSPQPTGWLQQIVSRETFVKLLVQDSDSASQDRARSSRETLVSK